MIERQDFGRTGHASSRVIFGAAALWQVTQSEADRTLEVLLRHGVNHIDTAASYGDSELRIGPWMREHRRSFFLATKTGKRTYTEAKEEFQRSLERLRVDQVDLLQLHCLVDPGEWDTAFGAEGALEALLEARENGLTRFIGVTGHGVTVAAMHRRSLARFEFDSVLLPYNPVMIENAAYAADFEALLLECTRRRIAVQTIKSIARGAWPSEQHSRATWYEPLEAEADIELAVRWVLARREVFLNSVGDIHLLPKVLDAAARFSAAPSPADVQALVQRANIQPLFT
ncbi:MAG TPA: aldo/keto reductase [Polyangiaceae bacterium]|nr:aldo/keto reductase [Polyangiaceae bacterium]